MSPEGAWLMLRGVGARLSTTGDGPKIARWGGYTSLLAGGTFISERGLVLSGGLGASFFQYSVAGDGVEGLGLAAHTNLGWAF